MARHLLKQASPLLHQVAGVIPQSTGRNVNSVYQNILSIRSNDGPFSYSYCVFHYWCTLQHKMKSESNVRLVNDVQRPFLVQQESIGETQPVIRCVSQSSHHRTTLTKNNINNIPGSANRQKKKTNIKEFIIKDNITDHDMAIKLTKMQNLLEKGKVLEIYIKHKSSVESENAKSASGSRIQNKLQEGLVGIKPLRMNYSNKTTIKFTTMLKDDEQET